MNEKKNLDRLFQEKFKDFEETPPEFVWENIQEILEEKKKRRVIPLWIRLSGVAALLLLSGILATLFFNDTENPAVNAPAVVIDNTTATPADAVKAAPATFPVNAAPSATGTTSENTSNANTAVASDDVNTNRTTPSNNNNINNSIALPAFSNNNNALAQEDKNTTIDTKNGRNNAIAKDDAVAVSSTKIQTENSTTNNISTNNKIQQPGISNLTPANEAVAELTTNKNTGNNTVNKTTDSQKQDVIKPVSANEGLAINTTQNGSGENPANAENNTAQKSNVIIDKNIPVTEAVAETEVDTTAKAQENELEKLLQDKLKGKQEEEKIAEESSKQKERWVIKPQVAPVFYSSLSDGSPINEQFASNSKSYDNDLSYGLGINYAVTDRISIRSGINTVNLSYATNDIAYYASLNSLTSNISQSKTGNIVVQNPGDGAPDTFVIDGQTTQLVEGSMIQKTGYIEVPLEMSYAILNDKFGIDVIGGVSTLFLNQNSVSVVSSTGMSTQVGQAQNLNNLHFSTNVGVGFKYRFWQSFQASFEPTFKYQVNAYSRDAGNFKPYFIGLYSGVSFSF